MPVATQASGLAAALIVAIPASNVAGRPIIHLSLSDHGEEVVNLNAVGENFQILARSIEACGLPPRNK
jgi:hypothetical protein